MSAATASAAPERADRRESTSGVGCSGHGSSNSRSAATGGHPLCRFCGRPLFARESVERGYGYACGVEQGLIRTRSRHGPHWWRRRGTGLSRVHVRESVDCPRCGALAGERCVGKLGQLRDANHLERADLAYDLRGRP